MRGLTVRRLVAPTIACVVALCLPTAYADARSPCANASATAGTLGVAATTHSLLCVVNAERRRHGLSSLRASRPLGRAATRHASDMARRNFFAHVSPGGRTTRARVARTGYLSRARLWSLGETLVRGAGRRGSPRALLRRLLASPPHRAILLSPRFREVGIGVALGSRSRGRARVVTVALDLGVRR